MGEKFVMVPVPEDRVLEIMALLAGQEPDSHNARAPTGLGDGNSEGAAMRDEPGDGFEHDHVLRESYAKWADMTLPLVERAYLDSPEGGAHRELFDFLADHPDERLRYREAADALGWNPHQFATRIGSYMRRAKGRYDELRPFHIYKDPRGTWWIWMDAARADAIRRLRERNSLR
jgi:hypothetical protein